MTEDLTPADDTKQNKEEKSASPFTRFRNWLLDSYNGLFKIVIQPQLPSLRFMMLGLIAFLLGMVWAYNIAPIQFYNAAPSQLSPSARDQWVRFVAISYPDVYNEEEAVRLLRQVEDPAGTVQRLIESDAGVANGQPLRITVELQEIQDIAQQAQPGIEAPSQGSILSSIFTFIIAAIAYLIIINVFALAWGLLIGGFFERGYQTIKKRIVGESEDDKRARIEMEGIRQRKELQARMIEESAKEAASSEYGPPIMQRISPYQKGRAYDDSFAIEDNNDMFLGECGATIAKTIGNNDLAAVEIWLFDKDDFVRTLNKLFVSEHVYNDPVARSELESKVENPQTDIVMVTPDATINLETDNLLVRAKIMEFEYGSDADLPPNSHFESMNIRVEGWEKSSTEGGTSTPAVPPPVPAASGLPSLDSYEIGPPPDLPSADSNPTQTAAVPPSTPASSGSRPLDSYEIGPPPELPDNKPAPPPPPSSVPGQATQNEEDDPFGGTGDFTPIGR